MLHVVAGVYFDGYAWWWLLVGLLVYLLVLAAGSYFITWNFYLRSTNKIPLLKVNLSEAQFGVTPRGKVVALTFDDGPVAATETILKVLEQENVKATFFVIGERVLEHPSLLKKMHDAGHIIGNHSYHHRSSFDWQSAKRMQEELEQTNKVISSITGATVSLFRPPYGVTNPNLAKAILRTNMKSIGWNLRSYDTMATDPRRLLQKISRKTRPGSILLLHDRCEITAAILSNLIQSLKTKGYSFVQI